MDNIALPLVKNLLVRDALNHTYSTDPKNILFLPVDGYSANRLVYVVNTHDQQMRVRIYGYSGGGAAYCDVIFDETLAATNGRGLFYADETHPLLKIPLLAIETIITPLAQPTTGAVNVTMIVEPR